MTIMEPVAVITNVSASKAAHKVGKMFHTVYDQACSDLIDMRVQDLAGHRKLCPKNATSFGFGDEQALPGGSAKRKIGGRPAGAGYNPLERLREGRQAPHRTKAGMDDK